MIRNGPNGTLIIQTSRHYVDGGAMPIVIDASGQEVTWPFSAAAIYRLIEIEDAWAYLVNYDEDGAAELGIAKVPVSEVNAYVAANPIVKR